VKLSQPWKKPKWEYHDFQNYSNFVQLKGIVEQLMAQYKKSEEEFQKWQKDNNIRVVSN
jgi:predicted patatin/cPLA2 family phospholipase